MMGVGEGVGVGTEVGDGDGAGNGVTVGTRVALTNTVRGVGDGGLVGSLVAGVQANPEKVSTSAPRNRGAENV